MLDSPLATQNPNLMVFVPMLYAVWSDDILTASEMNGLHDGIQKQQWLNNEEKKFLNGFLDPSSPPSPRQLKSWLQEIRDLDLPPTTREGLIDIGVRLARKYGNNNADVINIEALTEIEQKLGAITHESVFQFLPESRQSGMNNPADKVYFSTQKMQSLLDGENAQIISQVKLLFTNGLIKKSFDKNTDSYREHVLTSCRVLAQHGLGAIAYPEYAGGKDDMRSYFSVMETLSYHDLSVVVKFGVQFGLFGMSVYFLGTEKHHKKYLKAIGSLTLPGCFAMTETGHGSNVRGIETTATYDHVKRSFIIHTPNEYARKEYIGNAALHGHMATVFAKLLVDGKDYGVGAFLVPIRDTQGNVVTGVRIEDCGHKMGLNGVDNGVIYFNNVEIPKENMLDRFASIDDEGHFQSPIASDNRRFFTMLGTLVGGRIGIPRAGLSAAKTGLTIAIRYGDQRRQFGPDGGTEVPILNYQTHQRRLMPLLANAYALHFALQHLTERFLKRTEQEMQEIEALAAGLKAFGTWNTTDTLQECREACGGKGYLSDNRIDELKADTDIFTTFEGDNTVLMQLVAKSRLSEFKQEFSNMNLFGMLNYVADQAKTSLAEKNPFIIRDTNEEHLLDPEFHLSAFSYRERSVLTSAAQRLKHYIDEGVDSFEAFNKCQHHLVQVGFAYIERIILEQFQQELDRTSDTACKTILTKVYQLFALTQIEKNKGWYLENGYMEGVKTKAIRKITDRLCAEVRAQSIGLTSAFGIPDNCLAPIAFSVLGKK